MFESNLLAITIIFIILSTVIAAFIRGRKKDKCLKDFAGDIVTLEDKTAKTVWGKLRVENTGLELQYTAKHKDADQHTESSFILYKFEYGNIQTFIRFHDDLTEQSRKKRNALLKRTYHPNLFRRLKRKTANIFKTIRDSIMEVSNVLLSQAKKATPAAKVLTTQDKYVSQMKNELIGSVETSYEPLLERYIGHLVVLEMVRDEKVIELPGVLKDYTADFIELMDVDYSAGPEKAKQKADLVVPRKLALVRHLGE
jgi:hypothetical protein